jgi:hypothetical protein
MVSLTPTIEHRDKKKNNDSTVSICFFYGNWNYLGMFFLSQFRLVYSQQDGFLFISK